MKTRSSSQSVRQCVAIAFVLALLAMPFPASSAGASPTNTLTADQVLERYVTALGGSNKLAAITTRYTQRTASGGPGAGLAGKLLQKAPGKMLIVLPSGQKYGCDGTNAWDQNARGDVRDVSRDVRVRFLQDTDFPPGLNLRRRFQTVSIVAHEPSAPAGVVVVEGKLVDGRIEHLFFEDATGLLVRREYFAAGGKTPEASCNYGDYRAVDGVQIPFSVHLNPGSAVSFNYQVVEITHNLALDDAKFAKPKPR